VVRLENTLKKNLSPILSFPLPSYPLPTTHSFPPLSRFPPLPFLPSGGRGRGGLPRVNDDDDDDYRATTTTMTTAGRVVAPSLDPSPLRSGGGEGRRRWRGQRALATTTKTTAGRQQPYRATTTTSAGRVAGSLPNPPLPDPAEGGREAAAATTCNRGVRWRRRRCFFLSLHVH
jgi:hypothetical protein